MRIANNAKSFIIETIREKDIIQKKVNEMSGFCFDCKYLDKSRYKESENGLEQKLYGCNYGGLKRFVCGWVQKDSELKNMGCSFHEDEEHYEQLRLW